MNRTASTKGPPWAHRRGGRKDHVHPGLTVLTALVQVVGVRIAATPADPRLTTLAYVLLLAGPLALMARRANPVAAYAVAGGATAWYALSPYPGGPFYLAAIFALFTAVRTGHRGGAWLVTAVSYAVTVTLGVRLYDWTLSRALVLAGWLLVALVLAEANRVRSEQFANAARVRSEQARARAEQQRRQASEERLRIARELHDVIGHHLSLINVQAGVGLHLMDSQPDSARTALAAIKQASAEALREVRGVLGALRPVDESAPLAPAPSIERLADLLADVDAAGLPVEAQFVGERRPLPAEVERAAYRIVQEALTNVRRHAGPQARATVTIGYAGSGLTVTVEDDGAGAAGGELASQPGAGIPGMRERAVALGGTLVAGARPGGGFRVQAMLPLEAG